MASSEARSHKGYCALCRSRCGAVYTTQGGRLTDVRPDDEHPTGGAMCAKGRAAPELVHHPARLRTALRRTSPKGSADPGWEPVDFDVALDEIADRMAAICSESGPQAVAFAVTTPSGSPISDSIDWIQRLAWQFGSPNMLASVEACNFQKDHVQALTFGRPLGVPDYANADTIVLWGHNPARTWLAEARIIGDAKRRGAKLVVIDPKRGGSGEDADLWLGVRPGTDAALAMGGIRALLNGNGWHESFVHDWTDAAFLIDLNAMRRMRASALPIGGVDVDGQERFVAMGLDGFARAVDPRRLSTPARFDLDFRGIVAGRRVATALSLLRERADPWTLDRVATETGIDAAQLAEFYSLLALSPRIAYYHWTGVSQSGTASQTTRALAALFALRDDVDAEGGNRWFDAPAVRPIADPDLLSGAQRALALGLRELPLGPPAHGYVTARDLCRAIEEGEPYRVRALIGFGANMHGSHADAARTVRALRKLEFQVHCDLFETPMAQDADILLPVTSPWEHAALRVGFEISPQAAAHIQHRPKMLEAPGSARPDYAIARGLAARLFPSDPIWSEPVEKAWDGVLAPVGLSLADLVESGGSAQSPVTCGERRYRECDAQGRSAGFSTPTGRIEFFSETMAEHDYDPLPGACEQAQDDPAFPILLTTAKSGYYTHSSLRGLTSLRCRSPDPALDISPALANDTGLFEGDWARVSTANGAVRLRVRIDDRLSAGVAIAEYGWWQGADALGRVDMPLTGPESSNINAIIGDAHRDPVSGAPALRRVPCRIERETGLSRGNWHGDRVFTVAEKECIAGEAMRLRFRPADGAALPEFLPGQHIGLSIPGLEGRRFYSLISHGGPDESWEIAVRRNPGPAPGAFSLSHHVHDALAIGTPVMLTPPSGSFVISPLARRPLICIAGGIGITPFLGALRAFARAGRTPSIDIHHIVSTRAAASFADELIALSAKVPHAGFHIWARDEAGPFGWPDRHMVAIVDTIGDELLTARPLVYLCGPRPMMDAARAALVARGMPNADIIAEVFRSEMPIPADLAPATIMLNRQNRTFEWSRNAGTLLDAAMAAGVKLPSGCRVGQCESCAVRVLSGKFVCRSETELSDDVMLACRSFPLSDLVLDV